MTPQLALLTARLDAALLPPVIAQIDDVTVGLIDRALDARLSSLALILAIVAVAAIVMIGFYLIRKENRESANDKADRDLMKQQLDNNTALIAKIAVTNDLQRESNTLQKATNDKLDKLTDIDAKRIEQNSQSHSDMRQMATTMLELGQVVTVIARSLESQQSNVVTGVSIAMKEHLDQRDEKLGNDRTERDKVVDERLDALAHDTGDIKRMLIAMAAALGVEIKDVSFTRVATPEPPDPNEGLAKDTDDA